MLRSRKAQAVAKAAMGAGALIGVALVQMVAAAGAEELRLQRTDPGHLPPRPLGRAEPPPASQWSKREGSWMLYRFSEELSGLARIDWQLSRLCERGAFVQERDGRFLAATPGRSYGLAFGSGTNLRDPRKQAKAGEVYLFGRAETSACLVWSAPEAKLGKYLLVPAQPVPPLAKPPEPR
jgi:hypothetical protein